MSGVPFPPQDGAWAFRSRPDLSPPAVEVSTQAHDGTAPGYIFVAPERGGAGKGGAMIIDDSGQVVWFRPLRGPFGRTMNFGTQTYQGREVLTWGQTPGEYVIFDKSYREIASFRAANGYNGDHHEFLISPQDTALISIYDEVPRDLTSVGGPKDGVAIQGIIQELDIETGEVLFEWKSIDHVGLEETYVTPSEDHYPGIDYFHLNSIDVEPDNNLLISARETSTVYKIDRNSGRIIWRLGGKKSDFEMGPGTRFAFQHDARRLPDGTISIFDNGSLVFENGIPKAVEESRAIVLDLDAERMRASLVREYTPRQAIRRRGRKHAGAAERQRVRRVGQGTGRLGVRVMMGSCSSISGYRPNTSPTGPSAFRGAASRWTGPLRWRSGPPKPTGSLRQLERGHGSRPLGGIRRPGSRPTRIPGIHPPRRIRNGHVGADLRSVRRRASQTPFGTSVARSRASSARRLWRSTLSMSALWFLPRCAA